MTRTRASDRVRLRAEVLDDLHNLILALDRRLPRLLNSEEEAIAKDAAELRAKATEIIAKLEALPVDPAEPKSR